MADRLHREFEEWLERLPRQETSPRFNRHMEECDKCRRLYQNLNPVAASLRSLKDPASLSKKKLAELAEAAREAGTTRRNRLLVWKAALISLVSLPFVAAVNWLVATTGYDLLSHVSTAFARFFMVSFCVTAVILTGMAYAAVPILIGWFQSRKVRETVL